MTKQLSPTLVRFPRCAECQIVFPTELSPVTGQPYQQCRGCRQAVASTAQAREKPSRPSFSEVRNQLVRLVGGRCKRCGYHEFDSALAFRCLPQCKHDRKLNRLIAKFTMSTSDKNWQAMVAEVHRRTLLCANCIEAYHAQD